MWSWYSEAKKVEIQCNMNEKMEKCSNKNIGNGHIDLQGNRKKKKKRGGEEKYKNKETCNLFPDPA